MLIRNRAKVEWKLKEGEKEKQNRREGKNKRQKRYSKTCVFLQNKNMSSEF